MARPTTIKPKLTKTMAFRCTDTDYKTADRNLKLAGLKLSEFLRRTLINNETTIMAAPVQTEAERRQLFIISKASNNLNQLAHAMNSARLKGDIDQALCIDLLTKLDLIARHLKATL